MNYSLSRRYFLKASSVIALSQLVTSCGNSSEIFQILFLANSIPIQLIGDFRKIIKSESKVNFQPQTQLSQTFDRLLNLSTDKQAESQIKNLLNKIFNKSKTSPHLISLGDSWLSLAIENNLLQPLEVKSLTNWDKLSPSWQKLVRRNSQGNVTAEGEIYGAPYRWGSTVIAYRSDKLNKLGLTISDWQDLWQPELKDRLSLLDSPRETIGLTLKKLGYSYNTGDLTSIANLESELKILDEQVKFYSSDRYLEPLILGDTWVAVGWSNDVLSAAKRYPEIKFVIPDSGVSLWADLWVKPLVDRPSKAESKDFNSLVDKWLDFCMSDKAATQISLFTQGASPVLLSVKPEDLSKDLQKNPLLNSEIIKSDKSEFLLPQTTETAKQYRDLWLKIRKA